MADDSSTPANPRATGPAARNADDLIRFGNAVKRACLEAALQAYEDAGSQGLCAEGRWECAIGALRRLDIQAILGASA